MTTVNIRNGFGFQELPAAFEGTIHDADGCKFFIATTNDFKLTVDSEQEHGVIIAFGPDSMKNDGEHCSDGLVFSSNDDKKIIAAQLRELADWFEQQ
ncbi:hypothetical protein BI096_gp53 [Enterobacter phage Arya]|uniref:Uncharacterized protein n=1 Tax=Enterobacter phage Arya TaxID=1864622 RepID=A0A193GYF9_9CAUD|nr:hypothetical protein BI096_gp53 [Enterobacter phage Arya]ANN86152.1 hypothetical protein BI096_gp53 [Enterobacter phage Arya]